MCGAKPPYTIRLLDKHGLSCSLVAFLIRKSHDPLTAKPMNVFKSVSIGKLLVSQGQSLLLSRSEATVDGRRFSSPRDL